MNRLVAWILLTACATGYAADSAPTGDPREVRLTVRPGERFSTTGGDDIARLKQLASGVGWEFVPSAATTRGLKQIGIKVIRCINVDLPGDFAGDGQFIVQEPNRLQAHLTVCRELDARPHIVIATDLPPALQLREEDLPPPEKRGPADMGKAIFGPNDWTRFRAYCKAYFRYVLMTQRFAQAEFEVGNEPDIAGCPTPRPPKPPKGSAASYQVYLDLYRQVAQAAVEFEREQPSGRVRLGGPALAWAFGFRFAEFNWASRFLRDCGRQKIKLDFIGLHYYGNLSSLGGEYPATYPPFTAMLADTKRARDEHLPGTPIQITEWGPSCRIDNSAASRVNASHMGAAWSAAFLNTMLAHGIDSAIYLVTTDNAQCNAAGQRENVWGWPALFVQPQVFGEAYPKAAYHLFDMIHRLSGQRVAVECADPAVAALAAADVPRRTLWLLAWNFAARLPETEPAIELGTPARLCIHVADAPRVLGAGQAVGRAWLIGAQSSDAVSAFDRGEPLTRQNTSLRQMDDISTRVDSQGLVVRCTLPPSGVCLIQLGGPR